MPGWFRFALALSTDTNLLKRGSRIKKKSHIADWGDHRAAWAPGPDGLSHGEGFGAMCGHGIIGVVPVLPELGLTESTGRETVVGIDTPAGLAEARAHMEGGRVRRVSLVDVPY